MRVSALQLDSEYNQPEINNERVKTQIREIVKKDKPDVIVLPEMWNVSFFPEYLEETADKEGLETQTLLAELARKYKVNIIGGSIAANIKGRYFNTSYSFNRKGERIHTYHKVHLFSPASEDKVFQAGNEMGIFEVDG